MQRGEKLFARDHLGNGTVVGVQIKIEFAEELLLEAVGGAPVNEEGALVFQGGALVAVVRAEVADFVAALALLNFPAGHIGIDQEVMRRGEQRSSGADDENNAAGFGDLALGVVQEAGIEEIGDFDLIHAAEDGIIGEK